MCSSCAIWLNSAKKQSNRSLFVNGGVPLPIAALSPLLGLWERMSKCCLGYLDQLPPRQNNDGISLTGGSFDPDWQIKLLFNTENDIHHPITPIIDGPTFEETSYHRLAVNEHDNTTGSKHILPYIFATPQTKLYRQILYEIKNSRDQYLQYSYLSNSTAPAGGGSFNKGKTIGDNVVVVSHGCQNERH